MQRYTDHQGADIGAVGNDSEADHPIVPESTQHRGTLGGVGGHVGESGDSGIWEIRDCRSTLPGGTTLGEHAAVLRRSIIVVEHCQRADRLARTK